MKCEVFIACSIDGFIAQPDGNLDWLVEFQGEPRSTEQMEQDGDLGFTNFMDRISTVILGRKTYETISKFDSWPFAGKSTIIRSSQPEPSSRPPQVPADETVRWSNQPCHELVESLRKSNDHGNVYVDGGINIQDFLAHDCIDTLTITRVPVVLGSGIPLFGYSPKTIHFKHQNTIAYHNGMVQTIWERE